MTRGIAAARPAGGRRFWRDASGATTVEFAIVASVLIVVLFGAIEFGILAYRRNVAAEGARYGVRYAMVRGYDSGRTTAANRTTLATQTQTEVRARVAESRVDVTVTYPDGGTIPNAAGKRVQVKVAYPGTQRITNLFRAFTIADSAVAVIVY